MATEAANYYSFRCCETSEWCNSFILVPKAKGKVSLCLNLVQLHKAFITSIHRGSTVSDILSKLTGLKYLMMIDTSSRYHNLKLDEKSYLITVSCPFGKYQYIRLPFGAAPAGNMFQKKIDELFNDIPNVFGIADDNLIEGFNEDSMDHDVRLEQVLQRYSRITKAK